MIAVQIEAPIVNHRIDFSSERLPPHVAQAKIIVMFDDPDRQPIKADIVAIARVARASFPKGDPSLRQAEFKSMRAEWDGRGFGV